MSKPNLGLAQRPAWRLYIWLHVEGLIWFICHFLSLLPGAFTVLSYLSHFESVVGSNKKPIPMHLVLRCFPHISPIALIKKTTDQRAMVPWVPWVPCPWSTFGANLQGLWHWPRCVLMQIAMINHTNWHHKYSIMCYHGIMNAEIAQNIPAVSWNSSTWTRDTWWWGFTVSSSMLSGSLLQIKSANM